MRFLVKYILILYKIVYYYESDTKYFLRVNVTDIDDSKGGEEDPIASGRLEDIIKESMQVFWEFVRADKDNVNVISKHIGNDLKDPSISNLLVDIRTQLQKVILVKTLF